MGDGIERTIRYISSRRGSNGCMYVRLWESIEVSGLGLYLRDKYIRPHVNSAVEHSGPWTSEECCRGIDVESICAIKWIDGHLQHLRERWLVVHRNRRSVSGIPKGLTPAQRGPFAGYC
jgi:hypothetical protein